MSKDISRDEKTIIAVLNEAHDKGQACLAFAEIVRNTKLSRTRVKAALASLDAKEVIATEEHNVTSVYYVKERVKIAREKSKE